MTPWLRLTCIAMTIACCNSTSPLYLLHRYYMKPWAKWPKGDEYISQQAATLDHPLLNRLRDESIAINADWEDGYCTSMPQGNNLTSSP